MRPHTLTFGGIGAYAGTVEIDFDQLGALGLYLIVGPTGAGKTTIFDAMTYALFGKVAGERPLGGIISDHSHRVSPHVSFTFSHRDHRYFIQRIPTLEGKQAKTGDHFITKRDATDTIIETVTGQKKVTEYVTELIGLQADQFMKVILLPQNEFQKFLLANSSDKMPLLRALFGTHLYESIAFKLDNAASALYAEAKDAVREIENLKNQFTDIVSHLIDEGFVQYNIAELPATDTIINDVQDLFQKLEREAVTALEEFARAQATLTLGESEQQRFDATLRRAELLQIQQESHDMALKAQELLDTHERAIPVASNANTAQQASATLHDAQEQLNLTRQKFADELAALHPNEPVIAPLRNLSPTDDPTLITQHLFRAREALAALQSAHEEIEALSAQIVLDEAACMSLSTSLDELQRSVADTSSALSEAKNRLEIARAGEVTYLDLSHKVQELDQLLAKADVEGSRSQLAIAQRQFDTISEQLADAELHLAQARRDHTLHLAGDLAQQLVADEPCPVCGSCEHPQPATPADDVDLESLEVARNTLLASRTREEGALKAAQLEFEKTMAVYNTLPSVEDQALLRQQLIDVKALVATLPELSQKVKQHESELTTLNTAVTDKSHELTNQRSQMQSRQKRREELETTTSSSLSADQVRNLSVQLEKLHSTCEQLSKTSNRYLQDLAAHEAAQAMLASLLQASDFSSIDDALNALLDDAKAQELMDICALAKQRQHEILTLDGTIGSDPVPVTRPDVALLQQQLEAARHVNNDASQRKGLIENRRNQLVALRDALARQGDDAEALQVRASNAVNVAKIIKGGGTSQMLSLERWVQRQLFEEVCEVASVQIAALTSNKYQLTLNSDGAKSAKKTAGLDIFVIDSHTGKTRSVGSLSGGEQFLTSLALSLALAEVVQRHSGGVEISTLFIDEGFGSLDSESLDLAVDVLRGLQDSGRTVGVISHVESMQQELHVGIRVSSSPTGSSLQVFA